MGQAPRLTCWKKPLVTSLGNRGSQVFSRWVFNPQSREHDMHIEADPKRQYGTVHLSFFFAFSQNSFAASTSCHTTQTMHKDSPVGTVTHHTHIVAHIYKNRQTNRHLCKKKKKKRSVKNRSTFEADHKDTFFTPVHSMNVQPSHRIRPMSYRW